MPDSERPKLTGWQVVGMQLMLWVGVEMVVMGWFWTSHSDAETPSLWLLAVTYGGALLMMSAAFLRSYYLYEQEASLRRRRERLEKRSAKVEARRAE